MKNEFCPFVIKLVMSLQSTFSQFKFAKWYACYYYIVSVVLLSRFIKCGVLLPWNSNELLTELLTNDLFLAPIVCKISVIHNGS